MAPGTFAPLHNGWEDALLRLGMSIILALCIGADRFIHKKPVDFRPFVIISLAACGLGLMIVELPFAFTDSNVSIDPAKVISGVMSGIGFLGAGALFRDKDIVKGAGSAVAIWAAGAIGLTYGIGFIWLAGLVSVGSVLLFFASRRFVDTDTYTAPFDTDAKRPDE